METLAPESLAAIPSAPSAATAPTGMAWQERYLLQLAPMDDIHREFVSLVNALLVAPPEADLLPLMDALVEHTERHFAMEQRWMEESHFPPTACHEDEHTKSLAVVTAVRDKVAAGDAALGRTLARELVPWFDNHVASMDWALATWIARTGYAATA